MSSSFSRRHIISSENLNLNVIDRLLNIFLYNSHPMRPKDCPCFMCFRSFETSNESARICKQVWTTCKLCKQVRTGTARFCFERLGAKIFEDHFDAGFRIYVQSVRHQIDKSFLTGSAYKFRMYTAMMCFSRALFS